MVGRVIGMQFDIFRKPVFGTTRLLVSMNSLKPILRIARSATSEINSLKDQRASVTQCQLNLGIANPRDRKFPDEARPSPRLCEGRDDSEAVYLVYLVHLVYLVYFVL